MESYPFLRDYLTRAVEFSEMLIVSTQCQPKSSHPTAKNTEDKTCGSESDEYDSSRTNDESDALMEHVRRAKDCSTRSKTHVLAAMDLSSILAASGTSSNIETDRIERIEQLASIMISVLSTEVVICPDPHDVKVLRSLCQLAVSPRFRIKLAKRRCAMLALTRHVSLVDHLTRGAVLITCTKLLDDESCRSILSRGAHENVDVFREGIVECAWIECDSNLQLLIIRILLGLAQVMDRTTNDILDVLQHYAYNGASDDVKTEAAIAFVNIVDHTIEEHCAYLRVVADFISFHSSQVRREALAALEEIISSPDSIMNLLTTTEVVAKAALLIQSSPKEECSQVLNIFRLLARSSLYHHYLLGETGGVLSSVVQIVTSERLDCCSMCKVYAEEITLSLLSNEENVPAFLPFCQLSPWIKKVMTSVFLDERSKLRISNLLAKLDGEILA